LNEAESKIERERQRAFLCVILVKVGLGFLDWIGLVKKRERMTEVILHVYDVTNSGSEKTNNTILNINKIFKDTIGLGGIFHSAVQVSPSLSIVCLIAVVTVELV
jgi:hypothetical protein